MKPLFRYDTLPFPMNSSFEGIMAGAGGLGIFIHGKGRKLIISVGLGDFWDHRGGMPWQKEHNYEAIRKALVSQDLEQVRAIFAERITGNAKRPTLLPFCRAELQLPSGWKLKNCTLDRLTGTVEITACWGKNLKKILFACSSVSGRAFGCSGFPSGSVVKLIPSYFLTGELADRLIPEPEVFEDPGICWFCQKLPADESGALLIRKEKNRFSALVIRGEKPSAEMEVPSFAAIKKNSVSWWKEYWHNAPDIIHDDEDMTSLYYRAFFKYGIMTDPAGPPPGLQGPWIEDDALPPWQGDYHFNINVQMCISPGFPSGKFHHLKPVFDMMLSWKELMAQNAKYFLGIDDGYMIAHAVDDRGTCMGGFWTGCIDHSCSAWMAHLMFRYCLYTGDKTFLKDEVLPFMKGILNVFYRMMEKDDNGQFSLPLTVSPEYNGSRLDAWGRNASFQLTVIHTLLDDLKQTAQLLDLKPDPLWQLIASNLPHLTLIEGENGPEIALWENQGLDICHRHHSHLAGITPFGTIDPDDEKFKSILDNSDRQWTVKGMGYWAGWSFPWASQLRTRFANPEGAALMLKIWLNAYTTSSGTSRYMPKFRGITMERQSRQIMQMDAEMGCISAILDMFACNDREVTHFFRGTARKPGKVSFKNIALPGGIRASGSMTDGKKIVISLTALRTGKASIALPGGERLTLSLSQGKKTTVVRELSC